ncbi:MAG: TetR/AcrR family transcriptional regulator [Pseudomonadota bacterium]
MAQTELKTRTGTATRRGGQRKAELIVAAAREVLRHKGSAGFSLRAVADAAGVRLANVQYYFPQREDLVRALFAAVADEYETLYKTALAQVSDCPRKRMEAVLRLNFSNICEPETRHFFLQLWALLDRLDADDGPLLRKFYHYDIDQLKRHIRALDPGAAESDLEIRANLLAALIEGSMVVWGNQPDPRQRKRLVDGAVTQAWLIVSPN